MKFKKLANLFGISVLATLAACSGTGSCPPDSNNGGTLSLKIDAPAQYPAGLPESITAVLTMTNTSNVDASNLVYSVPAPNESGNYTGVVITPHPNGLGEHCENIKAGTTCNFTATIGAYANPGSFTVTATPHSSSVVTRTLNKLLGNNSISVTANLGLVDVPDYPSFFYILPDTQTVMSESSNSTTVMLSVLVKSVPPDGLDNIVLVNESGESLVATSVGTPSYAVNSVNTYQVTIPTGTSLQYVKAQGYHNGATTCMLNVPNAFGYFAICSNQATINLAQTAAGILSVQPSYFKMNYAYESQVLKLTNVGSGIITNIAYPSWNTLAESQFSITNNTCGATLAIGDSCQMTVLYAPNSTSDTVKPVFTYNNGIANESTTITIPYEGITPPQFSSVTPVDGATGVSLVSSISITFNESMDITTLVPANFAVQKVSDSSPVTLVSPIYSADHKTVTFATSSGGANPALAPLTQYKVSIPNPANVKSFNGVVLDLPTATYPNGVISTFTTAAVTQCSPLGGGWGGVMNSTNNSFTKCYWQTDGSLYGCSGNGTNVPLFNNPSVILPDAYGSLYAANAGSADLAYYLGALYSGTFAQPAPLVNLTAPAISGARVAYNISKGFVFINTTGGLNICGITGTGALTTCTAASPTGLSADAYGAGFSSNGTSNGIFWTANKNANTISSCPATDNTNPVEIAQCNDAANGDAAVSAYLNKPSAIYATNSYVLITNSGDNTIVRCDQTNGVLSNCSPTGGNVIDPRAIVSGAASNNFMYITNQSDNSVTVCKNNNGELTDCNRMMYPNTFTSPTGIYVNDACSVG